jgi:hypothetical protein
LADLLPTHFGASLLLLFGHLDIHAEMLLMLALDLMGIFEGVVVQPQAMLLLLCSFWAGKNVVKILHLTSAVDWNTALALSPGAQQELTHQMKV